MKPGCYTRAAMRRWLLVFFVLFLPVQLSWAAVSSYCQHESGAAAKHFGHHEHQHQQASKAGDSDQGKTKTFGAVDADCHFCHACGPVIFSSAEVVSFIVSEPLFATWAADASRSNPSPRPERPNWVVLA